MNRGHHYMAGRFVSKLHDSFAEVGIDDLDPARFEKWIEPAFFGEHRFALHDAANAPFLE